MPMNIYARKGDKVVFNHPNAEFPRHEKTAEKHLEVGVTYTVERTVVGDLQTDVYLQEIEGVAFNSAHFDDTQA